MADVKVPKLLHKMSATAQKAWYKKQGMKMPSAGEKGKSAAAAKKVVVEPRKEVKAAPQSVRALNTARQKKYYEKGGRAPIGAGGSGGASSMAGVDQSTAKGIIKGIKAGINPKVALVRYTNEAVVDKVKKVNKEKLKNYVRGLGTKAVVAGKVPFDQRFSPLRAGRKALKQEETQIDEVTKKEAEAALGGPVKEKPKMPPGKQPAGYRYVRGLARKAMKAGLKKEEVAVDEAKKPDASMAMTNQLRMKAITTKDKKTLGKVADLMAAQKKLDKKNMKEESEMKYIEEKLTAADPASKWISDFVASDNPKFAGKSKKERIQQALGAYYATKRGKNEENEFLESKKMDKMKKEIEDEDEKEENEEDEDDDEEDEDENMKESNMGFKKYRKEKSQTVKMAEGLDAVGREDKDVDNDGDSDKTDVYLSKRRKAVGAAIRKKAAEKMGK